MIFFAVLSAFEFIIVSSVTFLYPRFSSFFIQLQINIILKLDGVLNLVGP